MCLKHMCDMRRRTLGFTLLFIFCSCAGLGYLTMNTLRVRTAMSAWREYRGSAPYVEDTLIEGVRAAAGRYTVELASRRVSLLGLATLWRLAPSPDTVLSARDPQPADCWAFSGSRGELRLLLPYAQPVYSMSVEHVAPDTTRSAPKLFTISAILSDDKKILLLRGEYRQDGPPKQYFGVKCDDPVKEIIFYVMSNHGNEQYTCIYRIDLYGEEHEKY